MHGDGSLPLAECETLRIQKDDYISTITVNYSDAKGLQYVLINTFDGKSITAGIAVNSIQTAT